MKTTIKLLVVLILMLATFGQHATASAGGGTGNGHFRDLGSDAYFYSTDPSGCIVTETSLFATQHYFQSPPGPGSEGPYAAVSIFQYDVCTGEQLLSAGGSTETNVDFQIDKKLDSAGLNAIVHLYDGVSQSEFDVFLDLAWTGFGKPHRETNHSHFHFPGCHFNAHSSGSYRSAEASGSISDGITNFTPDSALSATLFSVRSGQLMVGCN